MFMAQVVSKICFNSLLQTGNNQFSWLLKLACINLIWILYMLLEWRFLNTLSKKFHDKCRYNYTDKKTKIFPDLDDNVILPRFFLTFKQLIRHLFFISNIMMVYLGISIFKALDFYYFFFATLLVKRLLYSSCY